MAKAPYEFWRQPPGEAPGMTHALVTGVSDYAHLDPAGPDHAGQARTFGLRKLASPALSALKMARWLIANRQSLPGGLATVSLLAAPSAAELQSPDWQAFGGPAAPPMPDLAGFSGAVYEWKRDLAGDNAKRGVFYFAGHGIQKSKDNLVLLLADFGAPDIPVLRNSVELSNIVQGLAPDVDNPDIAQEQYYFIDACRVRPERLGRFSTVDSTKLFDIESLYDERATPILYATASEAEAEGRAGQTSFFCDALLQALEVATEGAQMQGPNTYRYPVTPEILREVVRLRLAALGAAQTPILGGVVSSTVFRYLPKRPDVDIEVTLAPAAFVSDTFVNLADPVTKGIALVLGPDPDNHPYKRPVPMGIYQVDLSRGEDENRQVCGSALCSVTHRNRLLGFELGNDAGGGG